MKLNKISLVCLLFISSSIIAGCSSQSKVTDLESKIEELEEKNEALSNQVVELTEENSDSDNVDDEISATSGASDHYSEEKKKIVDEIIALKKQLKGSLTKAERMEIVKQIKELSRQIGEVYND